MTHILIDVLRNSILITGLVVIMMMMIESMNIESRGMLFKGLKRTKLGQVVVGSLLGSIPGCMGGFAVVSLYTHKLLSFGALVAMMIASSGDEAFVMLAAVPKEALILFAILFVIAIVVGIVTDFIHDKIHGRKCSKHDHSDCGMESGCDEGFAVHEAELKAHDCCHHEPSPRHPERSEGSPTRHFGWKRISMFIGLAVFIAALATGQLAHDHTGHSHEGHEHAECEHNHSECKHEHSDCHHEHSEYHHHEHSGCGHQSDDSFKMNLLDEQWMNVLFAGLSVIVLIVLLFASDHFVEEHLWRHIIKKHLPVIFAWTFGVLLILGIGMQYVDIDRWISDNTALMILLATLIGIIPESGPHMIFVTMFAAGVIPFPVLLASSISQDGHASIPLLAESKKSFLWAKTINCAVALAAGYAAMLFC